MVDLSVYRWKIWGRGRGAYDNLQQWVDNVEPFPDAREVDDYHLDELNIHSLAEAIQQFTLLDLTYFPDTHNFFLNIVLKSSSEYLDSDSVFLQPDPSVTTPPNFYALPHGSLNFGNPIPLAWLDDSLFEASYSCSDISEEEQFPTYYRNLWIRFKSGKGFALHSLRQRSALPVEPDWEPEPPEKEYEPGDETSLSTWVSSEGVVEEVKDTGDSFSTTIKVPVTVVAQEITENASQLLEQLARVPSSFLRSWLFLEATTIFIDETTLPTPKHDGYLEAELDFEWINPSEEDRFLEKLNQDKPYCVEVKIEGITSAVFHAIFISRKDEDHYDRYSNELLFFFPVIPPRYKALLKG